MAGPLPARSITKYSIERLTLHLGELTAVERGDNCIVDAHTMVIPDDGFAASWLKDGEWMGE